MSHKLWIIKNRGMNDQNILITLVTFVIWWIIYFLNDQVVNHAVSRRGKMVSWLIHCLRIMKIDSDRFSSFRNIQDGSSNFEFAYPSVLQFVTVCFFPFGSIIPWFLSINNQKVFENRFISAITSSKISMKISLKISIQISKLYKTSFISMLF